MSVKISDPADVSIVDSKANNQRRAALKKALGFDQPPQERGAAINDPEYYAKMLGPKQRSWYDL